MFQPEPIRFGGDFWRKGKLFLDNLTGENVRLLEKPV